MQKQINIQLYKNLLVSDFGLVQNNTISSYYLVKSKKASFCYLNLFNIIKSLKVLSRGFLFLNQQIDNCIVLKICNPQHFLLLECFMKKKPFLTYRVVLQQDDIYDNISLDFTKFYFFLSDSSLTNNSTFYRQLILEKIFLIMRINLKVEFNSFGVYKFHSDITDFKKIIFLLLLINKLFLKIKN